MARRTVTCKSRLPVAHGQPLPELTSALTAIDIRGDAGGECVRGTPRGGGLLRRPDPAERQQRWRQGSR
jgi:hypothetical protein